jgi:hypothetical protein
MVVVLSQGIALAKADSLSSAIERGPISGNVANR